MPLLSLSCLLSLTPCLLSCGKLQYNSHINRSAKDLEEPHSFSLLFLWKKKRNNETKLTLTNWGERERTHMHTHPSRVEISKRHVWVSVYEHLRGCPLWVDLSRSTAEKSSPHPLRVSWGADRTVPVCSGLTSGTEAPTLPPFPCNIHPESWTHPH